MQDQEQVENKGLEQPGAKAKKAMTPEELHAERTAAHQRWLKNARPAAKAHIVVVPILTTDTKLRVGKTEIKANTPTVLSREDIRRVANECARNGKRWRMIELPENWKAWK